MADGMILDKSARFRGRGKADMCLRQRRGNSGANAAASSASRSRLTDAAAEHFYRYAIDSVRQSA